MSIRDKVFFDWSAGDPPATTRERRKKRFDYLKL
jgi:hypothetical protein